jgi:hypothetical protein
MKRWAPSVPLRFHSHASVAASADLPEPEGPTTMSIRLLGLEAGGAGITLSSESFCWGLSGRVETASLEDESGGSIHVLI